MVRRELGDDGHVEEGGLAAAKRFVTQTGMSAEGVDRHMYVSPLPSHPSYLWV